MKLLILLSRVPYPLEKGDKLRAYHLVKRLAASHEVYLFCLSDVPVARSHIDHLQQFCHHIEVFSLKRWKISLKLVFAFFGRLPFQVAYFANARAKKRVKEVLESYVPDHIICQLVRTTEYVRNVHDIGKTIDYMDTLSKGMERRAENAPFYLRPLLRAETLRLINYENLMFDMFDNRVIISEQDREYLYHPHRQNVQVIPNGVDTRYFHPMGMPIQYDLVFTGNMNYPPNIDSVMFLVREVLPLIKKAFPNISLLISGVDPSPRIKALAEKDMHIHVTGWVKDIRHSYATAKIFIAPMQIGTGLQNKLLEAMAMGLPCITSPLANNAVGAVDGESIMIGSLPEEYAAHVAYLLKNEKERERIARNGLDFVRSNFDWDVAAARLDRSIQQANAAMVDLSTGNKHSVLL